MTDREKLVKELRWWADGCDRTNSGCQVRPLLERAADELANGVTLATDNNVGGKWIPVTERLPKEQGYYLVAHQRSGCVSERFYYRDCPDLFVEVTGDPVTHWMPLPEPPMRKGENG